MSSPDLQTGFIRAEDLEEKNTLNSSNQVNMDLSQAAGKFSDDLIRLIVPSNHTENALVSPLSLLTVLSMLLLGAKNDSKTKLTNALRLPSNASQSDIDNYYHTLLSSYNGKTNENDDKLLISNMALIKKDQNLLQEYENGVKEKYQAQISQVDFANEGNAIMNKVNQWVNQSTQGLIPSLLDSPPNAENILMLLNSVYFEGKWRHKLYDMQEMDFHVSDSETKKASFIGKTEGFKYLEVPFGDSSNDKLQLVELQYKGQSSMVILLPPKNKTVNSVISEKSIYDLVKQVVAQNTRYINLTMPKFKFNVKSQMNQHIASLGAGDLFTDQADLSGITGKANLKVSDIKHATAIEVDEYGTKAAAVTSIEIVPMSMNYHPDPPLELTIDRPFAFVIYDKNSKLPIFVGKLEDPTP